MPPIHQSKSNSLFIHPISMAPLRREKTTCSLQRCSELTARHAQRLDRERESRAEHQLQSIRCRKSCRIVSSSSAFSPLPIHPPSKVNIPRLSSSWLSKGESYHPGEEAVQV
ncbi:hypothetical protein SAY87_025732 [Trapa incisa]|uniref:Uncharacterized protein n=1 Tax=Trapa incisa TaxID=236973 RepID=A0AAN7JK81_9MYRT|nr:hypothetical protein SAY87_025732 [Trapa incisa]